MPVNETLDLGTRLRERALCLEAVIVNGVFPGRFSADEARRLADLDGRLAPGARAALATALGEHRRGRAQRAQLRRLRRRVGTPVSTLPFLFEPELGSRHIELLSRRLEAAL
jgi:hypothetical protein